MMFISKKRSVKNIFFLMDKSTKEKQFLRKDSSQSYSSITLVDSHSSSFEGIKFSYSQGKNVSPLVYLL